jgi:hypothetical protein
LCKMMIGWLLQGSTASPIRMINLCVSSARLKTGIGIQQRPLCVRSAYRQRERGWTTAPYTGRPGTIAIGLNV